MRARPGSLLDHRSTNSAASVRHPVARRRAAHPPLDVLFRHGLRGRRHRPDRRHHRAAAHLLLQGGPFLDALSAAVTCTGIQFPLDHQADLRTRLRSLFGNRRKSYLVTRQKLLVATGAYLLAAHMETPSRLLFRAAADHLHAHFRFRGLLLAIFAKPSTEFTKCCLSFFAFVSGLWLKTDAGPRDGENRKWMRRQQEQPTLTWPLLPAQGNRRIKKFRRPLRSSRAVRIRTKAR